MTESVLYNFLTDLVLRGWSSQDLSEQVRILQVAFSKLENNRVPSGSWLRAAVYRECARVAKSMDASSQQASWQQAVGDPGVALIRAMQQVMSIPAKDLGDDVASLAPAGVAQLSAGVAQLRLQGSPGTESLHQEHSEGAGTISKMFQTAGVISQKGLPPQESRGRAAAAR